MAVVGRLACTVMPLRLAIVYATIIHGQSAVRAALAVWRSKDPTTPIGWGPAVALELSGSARARRALDEAVIDVLLERHTEGWP